MVALKALLLPATVCAFVPSSRLPLAPRSVSGRTTVTAVYGTPRPWREFAHEGFNTLVDNGMRDLLQALATP